MAPASEDELGTLDRARERRARAPLGGRLRPGMRRGWIDVALIVGLIVLACIAVLPQVARHVPLSALDEGTHLDYAWHASQLEIPAAGDLIAPEVRELWSCYGNELVPLPACGRSEPAEGFPLASNQYNFGHPPVYYFVTGVLARGIESVTASDFVSAARATGVVWLAAGMGVMHLALRRLGVGRWLAVSAAAAAGMWWATLGASAIVTNDAPFLLTTALGVLGLSYFLERRGSWPATAMLIAFAALAAGVKVMNALPFLAIAGAFVVLALLPSRWRPVVPRWRLLAVGAGMVAIVGAVYVLWTRFQGARGDAAWENPVEGINSGPITGAPFGEWLSTATRGLTHLGHSYVTAGTAQPDVVALVADVSSVIGLGAIAIGVAVGRRGSALAILALAALIGAAAWPTIVQLQSFLSSGGTHYFAQPSYRYGATTGSMAFAVLALVAQRLRWGGVAIAVCLGIVVVTLAAVLIG